MIVIIDNYDSFVFNIARYFQELGEGTEVFRNDVVSVSDLIDLKPRALVISPVRALQLRLEYLRPSSVNFRVAFQFSASAWDTSVLGAYSADGWRVHVALCTVGPRM